MKKIERLTFGRVIVWNTPVAIQSDTDLASLLGLKLISVYFDGVGRIDDTPIFLLDKLEIGDVVKGPAMIIDNTQTADWVSVKSG